MKREGRKTTAGVGPGAKRRGRLLHYNRSRAGTRAGEMNDKPVSGPQRSGGPETGKQRQTTAGEARPKPNEGGGGGKALLKWRRKFGAR